MVSSLQPIARQCKIAVFRVPAERKMGVISTTHAGQLACLTQKSGSLESSCNLLFAMQDGSEISILGEHAAQIIASTALVTIKVSVIGRPLGADQRFAYTANFPVQTSARH